MINRRMFCLSFTSLSVPIPDFQTWEIAAECAPQCGYCHKNIPATPLKRVWRYRDNYLYCSPFHAWLGHRELTDDDLL